jgi:hypothetical protein
MGDGAEEEDEGGVDSSRGGDAGLVRGSKQQGEGAGGESGDEKDGGGKQRAGPSSMEMQVQMGAFARGFVCKHVLALFFSWRMYLAFVLKPKWQTGKIRTVCQTKILSFGTADG